MKPTEVFTYGRTVYEFIKNTPLVTRGALNAQYRASSNDQRNRNLTWVLEALLANRYVFKYTDPDSSQTFFWSHECTRSPYTPDEPAELSYTPVDVFGKRPTDPEEITVAGDKEPLGTAVVPPPQLPPAATEPAPEPVTTSVHISKEMEAHAARLKSPMDKIYAVLRADPMKLFNKREQVLVDLLGGDPAECKRQLGRMFALGVIRRLRDPVDSRVSYYTLFGVCPISLMEDRTELSTPATRRRLAVTNGMKMASVNQYDSKLMIDLTTVKTRTPKVEEEADNDHSTEQEVDDTEEQEQEEAGATDGGTPLAFLGSNGGIVVLRTNGVTDEFDLDESMAVVELFLMMNHEGLRERLIKMKAA